MGILRAHTGAIGLNSTLLYKPGILYMYFIVRLKSLWLASPREKGSLNHPRTNSAFMIIRDFTNASEGAGVSTNGVGLIKRALASFIYRL